MTERRAWKFRPGSAAETIKYVLENGCIRLDYNTPGLRPEMTRDELFAVLRAHNPERSDKGLRAHVGQLDAIFNKVSRGDFALVPRDRGKSMMIGEIDSDAASIVGTEIEVRVHWLDPKVPVSRFERDLQYSFMAIHKFCGVSRNQAVQRIHKISQGKKDPGESQ